MSALKKYSSLLGFILVSALAGAVGVIFKPGAWYAVINKPSFTPPNWIFPVVWPILYLMMAVAAWIIWTKRGFDRGRLPLKWFAVQLALNAAWSWIFFGRHALGTALAEIMLLWIAIVFTLLLFWKINRWAGGLMAPYLLWISFALVLNFSIWHLNI